MSRLMRNLVLGFALLLMMTGRCAAHDLGVARIVLRESGTGRYLLTAEFPPQATASTALPQFPTRFKLTGDSPLSSTTGMVTYEFSCTESPLTTSDTINFPWDRQGLMVVVKWQDGATISRFFPHAEQGIEVSLAQLRAGSGSLAGAALHFMELGVEHILLGVDHLMFVLALLLLVRGNWMLIKTVTAFTVAHSITLALATLGWVSLPSQPVEAVIALSVVFLAVEIVQVRRDKVSLTVRSPWLVAFSFGLLHGLGFAAALSELGLSSPDIPTALLFFNVGVEFGQLVFVCAFLALRWALQQLEVKWPAWSGPIPSYAIGTLAMSWLISRIAIMS